MSWVLPADFQKYFNGGEETAPVDIHTTAPLTWDYSTQTIALPPASATADGYLSASAQNIGGVKTFTDATDATTIAGSGAVVTSGGVRAAKTVRGASIGIGADTGVQKAFSHLAPTETESAPKFTQVFAAIVSGVLQRITGDYEAAATDVTCTLYGPIDPANTTSDPASWATAIATSASSTVIAGGTLALHEFVFTNGPVITLGATYAVSFVRSTGFEFATETYGTPDHVTWGNGLLLPFQLITMDVYTTNDIPARLITSTGSIDGHSQVPALTTDSALGALSSRMIGQYKYDILNVTSPLTRTGPSTIGSMVYTAYDTASNSGSTYFSEVLTMNGKVLEVGSTTTLTYPNGTYSFGGQDNSWIVVFEGWIKADYSEVYTFKIGIDDMATMFLDQRVMFRPVYLSTETAQIYLTANHWYPIKIIWYNVAGVAQLTVTASSPSLGVDQPIAADHMASSGGIVQPVGITIPAKVTRTKTLAITSWGTVSGYTAPSGVLDGVLNCWSFPNGSNTYIFRYAQLTSDYRASTSAISLILSWYTTAAPTGAVIWYAGVYNNAGYGSAFNPASITNTAPLAVTVTGARTLMRTEISLVMSPAPSSDAPLVLTVFRSSTDTQTSAALLVSVSLKYTLGTIA